MNKRAYFVTPLLAILLMASVPAPRVFVPAKGSADLQSILDFHKDSRRADLHIDPYKVGTVRMVHTKSLSIAFVDALGLSSDLSVFHQVLIRKRGGKWRSIWGDGSGGTNECKEGIAHYSKIIHYVRRYGVNDRKLLAGFQDTVDKARKGDCDFGDFDIDETVLK